MISPQFVDDLRSDIHDVTHTSPLRGAVRTALDRLIDDWSSMHRRLGDRIDARVAARALDKELEAYHAAT